MGIAGGRPVIPLRATASSTVSHFPASFEGPLNPARARTSEAITRSPRTRRPPRPPQSTKSPRQTSHAPFHKPSAGSLWGNPITAPALMRSPWGQFVGSPAPPRSPNAGERILSRAWRLRRGAAGARSRSTPHNHSVGRAITGNVGKSSARGWPRCRRLVTAKKTQCASMKAERAVCNRKYLISHAGARIWSEQSKRCSKLKIDDDAR
jgi:hypothetical protein